MNQNELRLKEVISRCLKIDESEINENTSVDTVPLWDSLKHLELVLTLEGEFNVSFTSDQTIEILNYPLIKIVLSEHGITF
jgi:acyl carrier protein